MTQEDKPRKLLGVDGAQDVPEVLALARQIGYYANQLVRLAMSLRKRTMRGIPCAAL